MSESSEAQAKPAAAAIESLVLRQLAGLRFGEVTIHVHDGRVVQVERIERSRPLQPIPIG